MIKSRSSTINLGNSGESYSDMCIQLHVPVMFETKKLSRVRLRHLFASPDQPHIIKGQAQPLDLIKLRKQPVHYI